jgi:hypothetical protein
MLTVIIGYCSLMEIDRKCDTQLLLRGRGRIKSMVYNFTNLVPRACDPREGTRGSGIIRCRKPGILAKIEPRIPLQRPIRFLPETDYPRASRSFPRIAGSGNEIAISRVYIFGRRPKGGVFSHNFKFSQFPRVLI